MRGQTLGAAQEAHPQAQLVPSPPRHPAQGPALACIPGREGHEGALGAQRVSCRGLLPGNWDPNVGGLCCPGPQSSHLQSGGWGGCGRRWVPGPPNDPSWSKWDTRHWLRGESKGQGWGRPGVGAQFWLCAFTPLVIQTSFSDPGSGDQTSLGTCVLSQPTSARPNHASFNNHPGAGISPLLSHCLLQSSSHPCSCLAPEQPEGAQDIPPALCSGPSQAPTSPGVKAKSSHCLPRPRTTCPQDLLTSSAMQPLRPPSLLLPIHTRHPRAFALAAPSTWSALPTVAPFLASFAGRPSQTPDSKQQPLGLPWWSNG